MKTINKGKYDLEDRTLQFAKETAYWLKLIDTGDKASLDERRNALYQEARELMFILSSIMRKVQD